MNPLTTLLRTLMHPHAGRFTRTVLFLAAAWAAPAAAQARRPTFGELIALLQGGGEALARGDTAGYVRNIREAVEVAGAQPFVAYEHARALARIGERDSALLVLEGIAARGFSIGTRAEADSAFDTLRQDARFDAAIRAIQAAQTPISTSATAFELSERDLIPEGVAYDPATRTVFISSTYKRKIVAVEPDGSARDFVSQGSDRIGGVVGMEVDVRRRHLWAASGFAAELPTISGDSGLTDAGVIHKYDVDTGRLLKRYVLPSTRGERHFFNDLTIAPDGDVYLTDSSNGAVYTIGARADTIAVFAPAGTYLFPNGITRSADGRRLFVAHGHGIDVYDLRSRESWSVTAPDSISLVGIDGLAFYRGSLIAHQASAIGAVTRLVLDDVHRAVVRREIVERNHPRFVQPTTGEVAGDTYYYLANAQLRRFRDGKIFPWNELDPVLVLRAPLR